MRFRIPTALAVGAAAVLVATGLTAPAATGADDSLAAVSPYLSKQLKTLTGGARTTVLVHGDTLADANQAVAAAGMTKVTAFKKVGIVAARGTKAQIEAVRGLAGVEYVEGNAPVKLHQNTSNLATRGYEATQTLTGADGTKLTGKGVSVAVIDTGVDPTHPYLKNADGSSAVVANLRTLCDPTETLCQVLKVPNFLDTDTTALGGHGTHVNGIVAGRPTTLTSGEKLQGAAPGASLVSISAGAALLVLGADASLNWVLENHKAPCGAGVPASTCPPIKVTSNSYGSEGTFDPNSATVKIQRALAAEGVVTVWAAGNSGGDGTASTTNPPGQDPTPGIISVASYNDQNTGTRNGTVSDFSSRGASADKSTWPDISAPGEAITSSCRLYLVICATGLDFKNGPGPLDIGTFNTISGTSMACPHISGIVAQLFQANPNATPADIENALKSTAHKYTNGAPYDGGTSFDKGYGLVDVVAAAGAVR